MPGDKAVVFPCQIYTDTQSLDTAALCYRYISTGNTGQVATVLDTCSMDNNKGKSSFSHRTETLKDQKLLETSLHFFPTFYVQYCDLKDYFTSHEIS